MWSKAEDTVEISLLIVKPETKINVKTVQNWSTGWVDYLVMIIWKPRRCVLSYGNCHSWITYSSQVNQYETNSLVKEYGRKSDTFITTKSLRQDADFKWGIFIIRLKVIIGTATANTYGTIFNKYLQILMIIQRRIR